MSIGMGLRKKSRAFLRKRSSLEFFEGLSDTYYSMTRTEFILVFRQRKSQTVHSIGGAFRPRGEDAQVRKAWGSSGLPARRVRNEVSRAENEIAAQKKVGTAPATKMRDFQ